MTSSKTNTDEDPIETLRSASLALADARVAWFAAVNRLLPPRTEIEWIYVDKTLRGTIVHICNDRIRVRHTDTSTPAFSWINVGQIERIGSGASSNTVAGQEKKYGGDW